MTRLIDKDALVAEINKRIKVLRKHPMENHKTILHLDVLKQSLDTLEVKEVDLEKENFIKKEIGYIKGYREKATKMLDKLKEQKGEEV